MFTRLVVVPGFVLDTIYNCQRRPCVTLPLFRLVYCFKNFLPQKNGAKENSSVKPENLADLTYSTSSPLPYPIQDRGIKNEVIEKLVR